MITDVIQTEVLEHWQIWLMQRLPVRTSPPASRQSTFHTLEDPVRPASPSGLVSLGYSAPRRSLELNAEEAGDR